ncbi:dockerin [Pseudomonas sp. S36]|nr:dockerin [Pseudomonas sp. S36]
MTTANPLKIPVSGHLRYSPSHTAKLSYDRSRFSIELSEVCHD